jgi:uncharacterized protein
MRRKEREIPDQTEIEQVLLRFPVCRIGMYDGEWPYVVPVKFGYREWILYFHCAPEGRKVDILRRNPRGCFEADGDSEMIRGDMPCRWTFRYRSVIGVGIAHLVTDAGEKRMGLDVIMSHYAEGPFEYIDSALARTCVGRVDVESMTGKQGGY